MDSNELRTIAGRIERLAKSYDGTEVTAFYQSIANSARVSRSRGMNLSLQDEMLGTVMHVAAGAVTFSQVVYDSGPAHDGLVRQIAANPDMAKRLSDVADVAADLAEVLRGALEKVKQ